MRIETMKDLFFSELSDIYNAEKQILKALPKMADEATDPALKLVFENHLRETEGQVSRIEQVFRMMDHNIESEKCEALKGLVKETEELMKRVKDEEVLDAALIAAAQKVEHYEIASYGTLCAMAELLGYEEVAALLRENLNEEKGADDKLNNLAFDSVNEKAVKSFRGVESERSALF